MKFGTLVLFISFFDMNFSMMSLRYLLVEIEGGYEAKAEKSELKSQGAGKRVFMFICALLIWLKTGLIYHSLIFSKIIFNRSSPSILL